MAIRIWENINKCYKMESLNNEIRRVDKIEYAISVTDGEW